MKKFLTASTIAFFLLALAPHAFAQSVPPGGSCTQDTDCQDLNGTQYGCYPEGGGICTVNGDAPADGTVQPGGACTNDTSCADANGQSYGCYQGACTLNGDASAGVNGGNTNASTGFVPLAPIPGLTDSQSGANASSLAQFLQNLYKYLIGIAAILAVIEIIVGGIEYATVDNVGKKSAGRHRIEQAILGLVLVLSPALVFSLINPSILNLSLNLPALNTVNGSAGAPASGNNPVADQASGGTSVFKGTYMAVETFTSSAAAQAWSCPVSGQEKTVYSCQTVNNQTNSCSQYYATCTTPNITISGEASIGTINPTVTPFPADQTKYTTYSGECYRVRDELQSGQAGTASFDDGWGAGSNMDSCPSEDIPAGTHSASQTYSCRSNPMPTCSVSAS